MLWIETHRPKYFSEISSHKEIVNMLQSFTLQTVPNLVFHGQPGHNRKTLMYALIAHLYGKYPEPKQRTAEITVNSTAQTITYLESDEMIEISPSEYGTRDRHVVQSVIKSMAQTRPILSMFGSKTRNIRIIVINNAESLSRDAQAALRRTMEIYSSHFRLFMLCTEVSKLIEPIRSRSLFFRIRGFTNEEIIDICESVIKTESIDVDKNIIEAIAVGSSGDCRRALSILELHCFNKDEKEYKKQKPDFNNFKLGWEKQVLNIVSLIKNKPKAENFAQIRKEFYSLLNSCIPGTIILLEMARELSKASNEISEKIAKQALIYDERIRIGSKQLLHLEAFAASAMCIFFEHK